MLFFSIYFNRPTEIKEPQRDDYSTITLDSRKNISNDKTNKKYFYQIVHSLLSFSIDFCKILFYV